MKRNRLSALLLLAALCLPLSGCEFSSKSDIPYTKTGKDYGFAVSLSDTFAKDLCVVPVDHKEKKSKTWPASSTLIFDTTDQEFLRADHIYKELYPASITKLMTAYVAFKYADFSDTVTFSYEASHITEWGAKLCGFQEGDQVNMRDLLTAFLVFSGNDAGIAIAEHISGSVEEFARLMNQEALSLGATGSHFVNPHGLHDDGHYTTPYDIYLIFNALIKNPEFIEIIHTKDVSVSYVTAEKKKSVKAFVNTNRFLNGKMDPPDGVTVIGGKTGTTQKAGSCLVLYSQGKNKHDYISIVFKAENGDSLFNQMYSLLELIPDN